MKREQQRYQQRIATLEADLKQAQAQAEQERMRRIKEEDSRIKAEHRVRKLETKLAAHCAQLDDDDDDDKTSEAEGRDTLRGGRACVDGQEDLIQVRGD